MWNYLQTKLGLFLIRDRLNAIEYQITTLRNDIVSTLVLDEQDPRRQNVSQQLGDQMIKKMLAEDKARKHTLGEL